MGMFGARICSGFEGELWIIGFGTLQSKSFIWVQSWDGLQFHLNCRIVQNAEFHIFRGVGVAFLQIQMNGIIIFKVN